VERQPSGGTVVVDEFVQSAFDDRDDALIEEVDLSWIDVAARHPKPELRECGTSRQTDVSGADDGDLLNGLVAQGDLDWGVGETTTL
jgi:hypothetical protein